MLYEWVGDFMSKDAPWTYEHWHRWTPRKTVKTKLGYEILERCRGCGELKSTLITADLETGRSFAVAKTKTISKTTETP